MTKINKRRVEEFIRVDHAGERGAVKIYEGQLLALNTFVKDENLKKTIEEMKVHEKEHCEFFENEILNVSLPERITCVVQETEPTIKGQTAANSSKPAVLENGVRIMVPQFVSEGEKILVSTETFEYLERV